MFWCFLLYHQNKFFTTYIALVIRQKGESQNECYKKTKHDKFSEKRFL